MGLKQKIFNLPLGRRKFLISGVWTSLLILISPVLNLFGRTNHSKDIPCGELDRLVEIAQKYGVEFGGEDVFRMSITTKGGQNVRI